MRRDTDRRAVRKPPPTGSSRGKAGGGLPREPGATFGPPSPLVGLLIEPDPASDRELAQGGRLFLVPPLRHALLLVQERSHYATNLLIRRHGVHKPLSPVMKSGGAVPLEGGDDQ